MTDEPGFRPETRSTYEPKGRRMALSRRKRSFVKEETLCAW